MEDTTKLQPLPTSVKSEQTQISEPTLSFLPLGGIGDVTKNMYVYEYQDQILLVDCGLGFADETMLGVDLLLPDISYLFNPNKKIVAMVLTHGHEDHIGALPFVLPQLPQFPIFASPLTAALANEKLQEFGIVNRVQTVGFDKGSQKIGSFAFSFIQITHSVPDSANIFIETPVGNFYHGSDFKFDLTPADGKRTDFAKIVSSAQKGIRALMTDCLGAERPGFTASEEDLEENFAEAMRSCTGKFIITTYSSNISRLNQTIQAAARFNKKVCFVGRSLIKAKTVGQRLGYLHLKETMEVEIEHLKNYKDNQLLLLVAGSQGQENSALSRIANGEHREIRLSTQDVVVFSSDSIPGNETTVNAVIDTLSKKGVKVLYSTISNKFHVSGHGSAQDHLLMMSLTHPEHIIPISGTYKHMVAYKSLAEKMGYTNKTIHLLENGQELLFGKDTLRLGKKLETKNIYVDQVSGEEVESFVLRDREKLAKEGVVIIMVEVQAANGQLVDRPEIVGRGFSTKDTDLLASSLMKVLKKSLMNNKGRVTNWIHIRRQVGQIATRHIAQTLHRRPLVLPVVIEV